MITKKNIQVVLIGITTASLFWVLPWAVKLGTNESSGYPFTYYSSILNQFVQSIHEKGSVKYVDLDGNEYSRDMYDSIVPMFNYRQLMQDGRLPDTIKGEQITPRIIQTNQFFYRYSPRNFNTKKMNLYPMFESMSGRVKLESPDDMFSVGSSICFYDAESNQLKREKSAKFRSAMEKQGFRFPVKWITGNPSVRKAYDEGWFMLDTKGQLFHVKMVNGKPFVKNTGAGEKAEILWMETIETANRRFYGFVFDRQQNVYFLSDVSYDLVKLPIKPFDLNNNQMLIMANLFYWNVAITGEHEREYFVLDNKTLDRIDEYKAVNSLSRWEKIHPWIFPFYIEFESYYSNFIYPRFLGWTGKAFLLNLFIAMGYFIFCNEKRKSAKTIKCLFVLLTGICGLIALQLFKNQNSVTKKSILLK